MRAASLAAVFFLLPAAAAAQTETPREAAPKKDGVELELEIGFGACPDCAYDELGLSLGGRASYRWASGFALGAYIVSINANADGSCDSIDGSDADCYLDELVLILFGGEARYYPLTKSDTSFDPYVAVGVGWGVGASRAGGPDLAEYSGLAFLPRFGAIGLLSDTVAIGGSVGRTFTLWTSSCNDGVSSTGDDGDFTCEDDRVNNPNAWILTLDAEIKF